MFILYRENYDISAERYKISHKSSENYELAYT